MVRQLPLPLSTTTQGRRGVSAVWLVIVCLAWFAPASAAAASRLVIDVAADPGTGLGEPQINVNPRDPSDVVIGENNTGVSVSHDGGLKFKQVAMSNPGDNALTVRPDGTFAYTSLDGELYTSTNGGDSWQATGNWVGAVAAQMQAGMPVPGWDPLVAREVGCNAPDPGGPVEAPTGDGPGRQAIGCDRPWISADTSTGALYASFVDHADGPGGRLSVPWELTNLGCRDTVLINPVFECGREYVTSSTDRGHTWSRFFPVDTTTYPAGGTGGFTSPSVASGGVLAAAYAASSGPHCRYCVVFETSHDRGMHWP